MILKKMNETINDQTSPTLTTEDVQMILKKEDLRIVTYQLIFILLELYFVSY